MAAVSAAKRVKSAISVARIRLTDASEARSGQILDVLQAGVILVDGHGVVLEANPFACSLLGVEVLDVVGTPIAGLLESLAELRGRLRADGRGEVPYLRRDGREMTLGFGLSELAAQSGTVILFQDVSSLADLRRQRDKLLQIAAVGEVLPTILHELRNPLAAVTTMLELLVEEATGPLQHDLHTVLNEVRRMILTLQGLGGLDGRLASTRNQAIDEAVEEAVEVLRPTAARRGVTLSSAVSTMPLLPLSREVIKGVVFNLVRNAIDACRTGQSIEVRARLRPEGAGPALFELIVADTGKGMSEAVRAHCTELFFTDKEAGSGIGLAICREVAERGQGQLLIDSEPNRGTTITLRVPTRTRGGTTCPESTV